MSPAANGGSVASPAPAPFAVPSPSANSMPNGGQKQTIQARRIERAASEAQNQLQNATRQAQAQAQAQQSQPSPYTPVNNFSHASEVTNATTPTAVSSSGAATPRQSHSRPRTANSTGPPTSGVPPLRAAQDGISEVIKRECRRTSELLNPCLRSFRAQLRMSPSRLLRPLLYLPAARARAPGPRWLRARNLPLPR